MDQIKITISDNVRAYTFVVIDKKFVFEIPPYNLAGLTPDEILKTDLSMILRSLNDIPRTRLLVEPKKTLEDILPPDGDRDS